MSRTDGSLEVERLAFITNFGFATCIPCIYVYISIYASFIFKSFFYLFLLSRFLSIVGGSADQIGNADLRLCVESKVKSSSVEELLKTVDTTPETLKLIIDGLTQPPGFDIRQSKKPCCSHSKLMNKYAKAKVS